MGEKLQIEKLKISALNLQTTADYFINAIMIIIIKPKKQINGKLIYN